MHVTNPTHRTAAAEPRGERPIPGAILLAAMLAAAFPGLPPRAADAALPDNEALRHYRSLGAPRLSPDAQRVLVEVKDATADGGKSHLWLTGAGLAAARQLTYSPDGDKEGESAAAWLPDGQAILFIAHRSGRAGLYRLPLDGGEAQPIEIKVPVAVDTSLAADALPTAAAAPAATAATAAAPAALPVDVTAYEIAPDGRQFAVIAHDPETPGEKAAKEAKADAEWVDHDPHRTRLYLVDAATSKATPVPIAADVANAAFSPDGTTLLVVSELPGNAADLGPAGATWLVPLARPSQPERLAAIPASVERAIWSADGRSIAYLAASQRDAPPSVEDLYLYDRASGTTRNLSDGLAGSIDNPQLVALPDGAIAALVAHGLEATLGNFRAGAKQPGLLKLPFAVLEEFATNRDTRSWAFLGSSGGEPPALYLARQLGEPPLRLATPAVAPQNTLSVRPKRIEWRNEGLTIEGLLYLPRAAEHAKVPLVVQVHGGPTGVYQDANSQFVDFLVGHGWAVLRSNPRGSIGRGAAFAAANKNDLGGADYRDIMAGVDFVLQHEPLDARRMALIGYSYGGEMAGFVEGKTTRFRAIVSGAPVIDQFSEYGTENGSWYDRWFYGRPWEHFADAWRQSPLAGVARAQTPFLLLQGQGDVTDPPGQAEEMYRALRQMNVAVDLVTYPRDGHGVLAKAMNGLPSNEPWHGFDARRRVEAFLSRAFATAH
jgi:dipeptidyl aminopeptidase/acylaminoacyl peptidase